MAFAKGEIRKFSAIGLFGFLTLAIGCGGGGGSNTTTKTITPTQNTQTITVDGGPASFLALNQGIYANAAFATISVCAPGSTTNCQQIDHLLVDTGSVGIRLLSASSGGEFSLSLPTNSVNSNPLGECLQFVDNSFLWGPVKTADVKIAGEQASSLPISVVGDTSFSTVPSTCSNVGGPDNDTLAALGANGILGVGIIQYDCPACVSGAGTAPQGAYYDCPSTGCVPTFVSLAQEVQNPINLFPADNNGVIIELPAATTPQGSLTGSMVFGIGTQADNGLGSATALTMDTSGYITTTLNGATMPQSFIDSGSNGLFFDDSALVNCPTATGFYCPASPTALSAVNTGSNGATSTVNFTVTNAESAFSTFPNDSVFPGLAGAGGSNGATFDFGLPFFFGRNVYTSTQSTFVAGGPLPYWAY